MWWLHINILDIIIFITDDLSDDADINKQSRTLFVQGNIILCKCYMCSINVKLTLFRTYCSPVYYVQLWWNYKKFTINILHIAHQNLISCFFLNIKEPVLYALCLMYNAVNL